MYIADVEEDGSFSDEREFIYNSTDYSVGHPSITKDGKTSYKTWNLRIVGLLGKKVTKYLPPVSVLPEKVTTNFLKREEYRKSNVLEI